VFGVTRFEFDVDHFGGVLSQEFFAFEVEGSGGIVGSNFGDVVVLFEKFVPVERLAKLVDVFGSV